MVVLVCRQYYCVPLSVSTIKHLGFFGMNYPGLQCGTKDPGLKLKDTIY